ncbi:MAG: acyl-CoA dehydrogenase [Cycloclasticus sp.]|nr:acyl-CoA dehydrogenase [Cycloclasticus sp.]
MNELSQLIEDSATRLFEGFATEQAYQTMESGEFPQTLWQDFVNDGWLRTALTEEQGGAGLGLAGGFTLMRLAGYHAVPLPIVESLIATYLAASSGIEINDELLVPALISHPIDQSSDLVLSNIPWARHASGVLFVFPVDDQLHTVVIRLGDLTISSDHNMAGEPRDEITINPKQLIANNTLSGMSVEQIYSWLALGRAAQISGALRKVLLRTVDYANERSQFGRQIGKFQAVQQQLAVQAEMTSAAICAVDAAIAHLDTEQEWELIACAKITNSEAAGYAAKTAHAVHAAIGFTQEYPLQLSTRRLWSWRDEYGNEGDWSSKLGRHCMQLENDSLWSWLTTQTT